MKRAFSGKQRKHPPPITRSNLVTEKTIRIDFASLFLLFLLKAIFSTCRKDIFLLSDKELKAWNFFLSLRRRRVCIYVCVCAYKLRYMAHYGKIFISREHEAGRKSLIKCKLLLPSHQCRGRLWSARALERV